MPLSRNLFLASGVLALALASAACGDTTEPLPVDPAPDVLSPLEPGPTAVPPETGAAPSTPAPVPASAPDVAPAPIPTSEPGTPAVSIAGDALKPSQTAPGPVPAAFRHVWAIDRAGCTANPGLTRIAIEPSAVEFYGDRAAVLSATTPHEGALTLKVVRAAEGDVSNETHALVLVDGGDALTYQRRGESFRYVLCQ